jgi:hypothetical protein
MTNGRGIETPASKVATAEAGLILAIRLNAEVLAGRINTSIYQREVKVFTGGTGLVVPAFSSGTHNDLSLGMYNFIQLALSASALTVDETLDEVFGKLSAEEDKDRLCLRMMVNQLRNAFAHNPWRPKWLIFPKYRQVYPIMLDDGTSFTFDATNLDGDGVKPEQIGGIEFWVKLLQHCTRLVA